MKRPSALKYSWKYNSVTKYSYISGYKCWKSVMIFQFRTSTKYIKLTECNIYIYIYIYTYTHTHIYIYIYICVCVHHTYRVDLLRDQRSRRFLNYAVKVWDTNQSLTKTERPLNISASLSMAFASSGRLFSTFKVNIKQAKVSKISI